MLAPLAAVIFAPFLLCCGGARLAASCKPLLPDDPADRVFTGESRRADEREARTGAVVDAFVQAASQLGVRVTSEQLFKAVRTAEGDEEEFFVVETAEAVPVEIRNTRRAFCRSRGDGVMRATVVIPAGEWARIMRMHRGRTALIVDCRTEPEGGCGEETLAALREKARQAGLAVSSTVKASAQAALADTRSAMELGVRHKAAFLLFVTLRGRFHGTEAGVMYARSDISASLAETSDGKAQRAVAIEGVKGAQFARIGSVRYAPIDAVRKSMSAAVSELGERMEAWPR
jgi:hypothetical protein